MLVSRVTCPECGAVLKPAKPVAVGKKVTCPKCKANFAVAADEREDEAIKPAARSRPAPARKKPAPVVEEAIEAEPAIYGVVKEAGADVEQEEEDKKPNVNYVPDTSVKDPRGKAQATVVRPSNFLLLTGGISFFGWLFAYMAALWAVAFPELKPRATNPDAPPPQQGAGQQPKKADPTAWDEVSLRKDDKVRVVALILSTVIHALGMVYSGSIAYGAARVQQLESRGWGMAASIMAMIPINVMGLAGVLSRLAFQIFEVAEAAYVSIGLLVLLALASVGIGLINLMTLARPEVKAGFEYVAE